MTKKVSVVLLLIVAFLMVTGCSFFSNEKVIKEDGYSITLTKDFKKDEVDGFDVFYQNEKIGFTSIKETFSDLEKLGITKDSTLGEYGEVIKSTNNILKSFEESEDSSYMFVDYEKFISLKSYYYYTVIKKGSDGFWLFNFFCLKDDKDKELPNIKEYASSIKIY